MHALIRSMHQEIHYRLLKLLEHQPSCSQRVLARRLEISLGKVNYCLKALVDTGMIVPETDVGLGKPRRYRVTAQGRQARRLAAAAFLEHKTHELESLRREIERLKAELRHDVDRTSEEGHVRR